MINIYEKTLKILKSREEYLFLNYISTGLFFMILIFTLLLPHSIGLADNGDFHRVMSIAGIQHITLERDDIFFNYLRLNYVSTGDLHTPKTIQDIIIYLSLFINNIFNTEAHYSILYYSFLNIILYTTIYFMLVSKILSPMSIPVYIKILLITICFFLLLDGMFIYYFNSFYQDTMTIILLFLLSVYSSKNNLSRIFLLILLLLIITLKTQNIVFIFLLPLIIVLYKIQINFKNITIIMLVFSGSILLSINNANKYKGPNIYNSFFYGLVKNTDKNTTIEIFNSMNLDYTKYKDYIDKGYWPGGEDMKTNQPILYDEFYKKVTHSSIIISYLLNPSVLANNIFFGLKELVNNPAKINYLGNLQKDESINTEKIVIDTFLGNNLNNIFIITYVLSVLLSLFIVYKNSNCLKNNEKTILLFTFIVPLIFGLNFVGDGFYEFTKHCFSLYYVIIMLLMLKIIYVFEYIYSVKEK